MTIDEALARITEVDCAGKSLYQAGSVAKTLAMEVIILREELAEVKSIASYEVAVGWRDKYKRLREELADELVMSQAAYREIEKLREELAAQSELIQHEWASPYELAGLKSEIERLREKLASRTRDAEACYQYQLDQSKTIEKLKAEIERLREKVRIESEEAMTQKARADHLQRELTQLRKLCPDPGYYGDGREWKATQPTQGEGNDE